MSRPQSEINAEIELHRPEREARVRRMQLTAAVCEDVAKRMMEGEDMTSSGVIAAVGMREAAAKRASNFLDTSWTREFPEARLTVSLIVDEIRALPLPEWKPDPREPKGCPTPGACSCPSPTDQLTADRDRLAIENETLVSGMTQLAERAVASSTVALAEIDRLRTFVRSARGIVQAYASEHPKLTFQGSYQGDPMGAHTWLAAESAEVGTNRDGGDPKVEAKQ